VGLTILDYTSTPVAHGRRRLSTSVHLHYYTAGSGPPLLLQHGIPKTSYYRHKVLPVLTPYYTCIVPDIRGIGDSTHPDSDYDMRAVASDLAELMAALDHGGFHICGEDWGAC
jgi:pimeloyl-ACP methyl ester carboxylesterase